MVKQDLEIEINLDTERSHELHRIQPSDPIENLSGVERCQRKYRANFKVRLFHTRNQLWRLRLTKMKDKVCIIDKMFAVFQQRPPIDLVGIYEQLCELNWSD